MKKIVILTILTLFVIQSGSFALWGKEREDRGADGRKERQHREYDQDYRPFKHLSEELKLTEKQLQDIRGLQIKARKESIPVHSRIKELRLELEEELISDRVSKVKVKNIMKKISEQEFLLKERQVETMFDVISLLDQEQKKKLKDLRIFGNFMGHNFYEKPYRGASCRK